ncbi:ankyrin repeat domain-containing protein [Pseudodesulfovibrio profundus]|nr:ankyrin repeat domain-containing protein [Pseudodesulfovibrio profundus]
MKRTQSILLILFLVFLTSCASHNPENLPLYAMSVREMFPGDMKTQALALAAADGDIERMDRLVARGADVNARGTYGVTLPTWVIQHPNISGFKHLMELGADPNIHWDNGKALLHWIAFKTDDIGIEYLKMALDIGGGDPNVERPSNGKRPIQNILWQRKYRNDGFALLYNAGADLDYKDKYDVSLVHHTIRAEAYDLVYFMLIQGVDYSESQKGIITTVKNQSERRGLVNANHPQYMWFWRCVNFFEKQGMSFDFLPADKRPAVLDTAPPPIASKLHKR